MAGKDTTGAPSKFWRDLAQVHADQLGTHGFGELKRQQALRYFTWDWRWRHIPRNEQFRFLVWATPPLDFVREVVTPQPLSAALWRGLPWRLADRWFYALATRLLWRYAGKHGDSEVLALGEPSLGNPPPVVWRGTLISQDLANCSLEAEAIRRALEGTSPRRSSRSAAATAGPRTACWASFPRRATRSSTSSPRCRSRAST